VTLCAARHCLFDWLSCPDSGRCPVPVALDAGRGSLSPTQVRTNATRYAVAAAFERKRDTASVLRMAKATRVTLERDGPFCASGLLQGLVFGRALALDSTYLTTQAAASPRTSPMADSLVGAVPDPAPNSTSNAIPASVKKPTKTKSATPVYLSARPLASLFMASFPASLISSDTLDYA